MVQLPLGEPFDVRPHPTELRARSLAAYREHRFLRIIEEAESEQGLDWIERKAADMKLLTVAVQAAIRHRRQYFHDRPRCF